MYRFSCLHPRFFADLSHFDSNYPNDYNSIYTDVYNQ